MNKTNTITLRVTDEEKELIFDKAKSFNMKVSDYIRFVSMNTKDITREVVPNK